MQQPSARIFLLSPARCSGTRATSLLQASFELAVLLRSAQGAPLGDVFAFLSSLYFRGKLGYAARFGAVSLAVPGTLIITPGHGLCRAATRVRTADLAAMAQVEVDADNPAFVPKRLLEVNLEAALAQGQFRPLRPTCLRCTARTPSAGSTSDAATTLTACS